MDIIEPIPNAPTHRLLRWNEVILTNGEPSKGLQAMAQWVPTDAEGNRLKGYPERASNRDVSIAFDSNNPKHMQLYVLLDEVIKEADAAR